MKLSSQFSAVALATLLAISVACARKPDDAKISGEIQSKFSQDSGLSSKQLQVQSSDGVVTLSGTVDNSAQRDAAGRQAATVSGVKTVVNNLTIGSAAALPTVASASSPPSSASAVTTAAKSPAGRKSRPARDTAMSADPPPASADPASAGSTPPPAAADSAPEVATQPPPPPPPPAPRQFIIDQGTQLTVRLIDPIDSEKNQSGDTFHATLNAPLSSDGEEAVPAGVEVTGHLVDVKSAGKFAGQSQVVLQLDSISSGGRSYSIQTDQYRKQAASRGKNTAEKVGGGAVLGTLIGALAGGGKGAAIGAAAGAGAGGGVQAATKSQQIKLPSETVLNFMLQAPVTVTQSPKPDADRPKLGDSQPQ